MIETERFNDEVLFARHPLSAISAPDVAELKRMAAANPRRRIRLCAHTDAGDTLHEMLIVHGRDAYVRPHRHRLKAESCHVVEGHALLFDFDEAGGIDGVVRLGPPQSGATFFRRTPPGLFHSLVIVSDWLVFLETTLGPFDAAQMEPAPWSPDEADSDAVAAFTGRLRADAERRAA